MKRAPHRWIHRLGIGVAFGMVIICLPTTAQASTVKRVAAIKNFPFKCPTPTTCQTVATPDTPIDLSLEAGATHYLIAALVFSASTTRADVVTVLSCQPKGTADRQLAAHGGNIGGASDGSGDTAYNSSWEVDTRLLFTAPATGTYTCTVKGLVTAHAGKSGTLSITGGYIEDKQVVGGVASELQSTVVRSLACRTNGTPSYCDFYVVRSGSTARLPTTTFHTNIPYTHFDVHADVQVDDCYAEDDAHGCPFPSNYPGVRPQPESRVITSIYVDEFDANGHLVQPGSHSPNVSSHWNSSHHHQVMMNDFVGVPINPAAVTISVYVATVYNGGEYSTVNSKNQSSYIFVVPKP